MDVDLTFAVNGRRFQVRGFGSYFRIWVLDLMFTIKVLGLPVGLKM